MSFKATDKVLKRMAELDYALVRVDFTGANPIGQKTLEAYGMTGIPYNLVIPPEGPAIQLPTVLTANMVLEAIE
ncbi:MAG: thiol:disulfide interchange protein [Kiritimatiellia bacterium]